MSIITYVSTMPSNLAILTTAHTAVAAKKRARRDQLKEVVFDEDARRSLNPPPPSILISSISQGFSYWLS